MCQRTSFVQGWFEACRRQKAREGQVKPYYGLQKNSGNPLWKHTKSFLGDLVRGSGDVPRARSGSQPLFHEQRSTCAHSVAGWSNPCPCFDRRKQKDLSRRPKHRKAWKYVFLEFCLSPGKHSLVIRGCDQPSFSTVCISGADQVLADTKGSLLDKASYPDPSDESWVFLVTPAHVTELTSAGADRCS